MRKLRIEYRYCLSLLHRRIERDCPTSWEEMEANQFVLAAGLQFGSQMDDLTFMSEFFRIKKSILLQMDSFQLFNLIRAAEFVCDPKEVVNRFFVDKIPGTRLLSPSPKLIGVSMRQFMFFDTFFFDYLNGKKRDDLVKMVMTLYMEKGERVDGFDTSSRIILIDKLDDRMLNSIFLNYVLIRKWLSRSFPLIFSFKDGEDEKEVKPSAAVAPSRPDWRSIVDDFADDDVLNLDKYYDMQAIDFFRIVTKRIQKYKRQAAEAALKKH